MNAYRTIARDSSTEIEVKRSRFLGDVVRVEDEAAAREVIESVRKRHHDARHHCTAFVLGPDSMLQRSNDDGEPAGTAGAPMLEVLTRRGISDVVAVVTRYFGGTLLGAGGLVRAYGDAVGTALDRAGVQERRLQRLIEVVVPAADAGRLDNQLRTMATIRDVAYGPEVTIAVAVPVDEAEAFGHRVAQFSAGGAQLRDVGQDWIDVPRPVT